MTTTTADLWEQKTKTPQPLPHSRAQTTGPTHTWIAIRRVPRENELEEEDELRKFATKEADEEAWGALKIL